MAPNGNRAACGGRGWMANWESGPSRNQGCPGSHGEGAMDTAPCSTSVGGACFRHLVGHNGNIAWRAEVVGGWVYLALMCQPHARIRWGRGGPKQITGRYSAVLLSRVRDSDYQRNQRGTTSAQTILTDAHGYDGMAEPNGDLSAGRNNTQLCRKR